MQWVLGENSRYLIRNKIDGIIFLQKIVKFTAIHLNVRVSCLEQAFIIPAFSF